MAGNESQSNKKIWFFVVTVLAVLALTGCFILYKYNMIYVCFTNYYI